MIEILRKTSKIIIGIGIAACVIMGVIMMNKMPFEGLCFVLIGVGSLLFELGFILVFLEMAENVEILKHRIRPYEKKEEEINK